MAFLGLFLGFTTSEPHSGVRSVASSDHYLSSVYSFHFQVIFGNEIKAFTRNNLFTDFFCGSISNSLPRGFLAAFFKTNTLKLLKQKAPTTRKY